MWMRGGLVQRGGQDGREVLRLVRVPRQAPLGVEREGATFVMSYMKTTKVIEMDDKSRMAITVPGIDYLRSVLGLQAASSSSTETEPE